jgi:hypothetical protein
VTSAQGRRTAAVLAALGALALLLAACSSSSSANPAEVVRNAPDKTVRAGSARVALDVSFTTAGTPNTITGDGLADLANRRASITLDIGSLASSLGTSSVETYLSADGIFVKLPGGLATGAKPWVKLNLSTLANQAGINLGSLGQLQSADPSQALEFLKGAVGDMKKVGSEDVRGASTTHYRGTLDLQQASSSVSADARSAVQQAIASLGTSTIPVDVWIDGSGRMRRMKFSVDPDGSGPTPPGTVQFEMFDFGVKADVQPPPPDQVTDLSSLLGGG